MLSADFPRLESGIESLRAANDAALEVQTAQILAHMIRQVVSSRKLDEDELTAILEQVTVLRANHAALPARTRHMLYHLDMMLRLRSEKNWTEQLAAWEPNREAIQSLKRHAHSEMESGLCGQSALFWIGICEHILGNADLAAYWTGRGHSYFRSPEYIKGPFRCSRSLCPPSLVAGVEGSNLANRHGSLRHEESAHPRGPGPVLLIAADAVYARKFLGIYFDSIAECAASSFSLIHVHLVDMDADMEAVRANLRERLKGIPLAFSSERLAGLADRLSYFTITRFLHASDLSNWYDRDLLITDADFYWKAEPDDMLQSARDDVVVMATTGFQSIFPWRHIKAGILYIPRNAMAVQFLDLLSDVLLTAFDPMGSNWGIDQNALGACVAHLEKRGHRFRAGHELGMERLFGIPQYLKTAP